ncbi:class III poly(R)-hydroxyalkanoic acid synthase subunit PhaE [Thermomonas alba]|uniref:class III poly(R)-hydroxyalkanoic acid synthase subunit PhaE n=1 Tax=Thermomonas alba TaxID=2888525 RepID=UPI0023D94D9F|nr:class III poly(R)-hydroxyalkanoic acid synthase subunit PhaE [Thermomonas alba]
MTDASNDFAALARQYWALWGDALRGAPATGGPAAAGLQDALGAWRAQLGGSDAFNGVLDHFQRQAGTWLAQMQQVAAQFAGRPHSAPDVARAWQGVVGANPVAGMVQGMQGPGLGNLTQWSEAAAPWLHGLRAQAEGMLGLPAFGLTREHQERAQALGRALLRLQRAQEAWNALLARASQDAFARFEAKLAEHEAPGRQLTSVRALFDVWVDAAEEAWVELALSHEYRHVLGELVNAQMQTRAAAQAIGEQMATALGLPGRVELDSAHRKIAELERAVRRMQRAPTADPPTHPAGAAKSAAGKAVKAGATRAAKAAPAKAGRTRRPAVKPAEKPATKTATKTTARKR